MIIKYLSIFFVYFFIFLFYFYIKKNCFFLKNLYNELNKINWISYKKSFYISLLVILISLFLSIFMFGIDILLIYIISIIYNFKKIK
ncbi:preprotein translocase subunit SecE [endosymbiont of Pachyrhynchus infernalis]|uniref:preprotein translocase subunit SecE n=1 Tax=endosymbiont of Pachyrhynchus infernalis TaxID=1971488 RepID=UPI00102E43FC|nr:preprotein translocase subunit SecE [endosymbiont of Pachyrhynchus infernalis]